MTKYHEVMDRVELSPEARQRILSNIQKADLTPARRNVIFFPQWKRYAAPDDMEGSVAVANGIVELADAQALSDAIGFPMPELSALPFPVSKTDYASYWGTMGQITYTGAAQSVAIRAQAGSEDISGDYREYAEVYEISIHGCAVTFRGGGGSVSTAVWSSGGFSYAISADNPISAEAMTALVAQII